MKPARSGSQLLEQLDSEFAWRLQEIVTMRKAVRNASGVSRTTLLRASVALLYAHWEGYVKTAAIRYGAYISTLNITFGEVRESFGGLKALGYVKQLHEINKRIFTASELLSTLREIDSEKVNLRLEDHISNVGNLNYELFEQIAELLSIKSAGYAAMRQLINESLLKLRNEIAHGDFLEIDAERFESLSEDILATMRQFKTDIQNAVATKAYLRAAPVRVQA